MRSALLRRVDGTWLQVRLANLAQRLAFRIDGTKLKIRRLLQIACAASDLCKNEKEKV